MEDDDGPRKQRGSRPPPAQGPDGMPFYFHASLGYVMHEHPAHCHWRGVARFLLEPLEEGLGSPGSGVRGLPM